MTKLDFDVQQSTYPPYLRQLPCFRTYPSDLELEKNLYNEASCPFSSSNVHGPFSQKVQLSMANFQKKADFIWGLVDMLRGDYLRREYVR